MTRALRQLICVMSLAASSACAHVSKLPGNDSPEPLSAAQLLEVAHATEQMGDRLRTQQYLLAALRAGADENQTVKWLLRLYVADGQYRLATEHAEDQLRRHPQDQELRLLLASLYDATEMSAFAIEQYERVLSTDPDEARAHFALATLLHDSRRDPLAADRHYRAYLALEPRGADAAEARSLLLKELP